MIPKTELFGKKVVLQLTLKRPALGSQCANQTQLIIDVIFNNLPIRAECVVVRFWTWGVVCVCIPASSFLPMLLKDRFLRNQLLSSRQTPTIASWPSDFAARVGKVGQTPPQLCLFHLQIRYIYVIFH